MGIIATCGTFVLGLSTSPTPTSNRRVPLPRGSLLAARPRAIPSGSSCPSGFLTRRHLVPRFAASGPVFRLGPLSLLHWVLLLHHARLCARSLGSGADGRVFPSAFESVFGHRACYALFFVYQIRLVARYWGGRTCFPAAVTYIVVVSCAKVNGFTAYLASDLF